MSKTPTQHKSWLHINKNAIKKLASILDGGLEVCLCRPR